MKINTNNWNKLRYTFYTPVYDSIGRVFSSSRSKAISGLDIKNGEKVLLVGAGTGLDLEFIPSGALVTATDLTPSMVEKMKRRNRKLNLPLEAMVMDGHRLAFPDNYFDKVILHLIIAVIPDPVACLREAERVLKPGGKISVFDKFVPENHRVTFKRKFLNPLANLLFSDITRKFETILASTGLIKVTDTAANFYGNFRIILVQKPLI